MEQFKEGDVVRVKCGGPAMSVLCVTRDYPMGDESMDTAVFCVWDCGQYFYEQAYPPYALDLVRYERRRYMRN